MTTPNYTEAQVKALKQGVTLATAKQFAKDWRKSPKSIIAKAVSICLLYTSDAADE